MTTSQQSLISQYSDIPFGNVPGRIILVFLSRSAAQAESNRRYVVQVAVAVTNGAKTKQVSLNLIIRAFLIIDLVSRVQEYLTLAQSAFTDLGQQSRDGISFYLPKVPSTSTELHFDESTTWYRLVDEMFGHLDEPPRILGVECRALFRKPEKRPIDKLIEELSEWIKATAEVDVNVAARGYVGAMRGFDRHQSVEMGKGYRVTRALLVTGTCDYCDASRLTSGGNCKASTSRHVGLE
ncbi:hypothetical protein QFC20_007146 [Naganishia adeliensis]|uniref:Uncharacterized protein n=1 Tax=Naganishia adeliensis TaxID=92952 RepID=A0ACC2V1V4_9TREE|nr:hypothetical protein QFC20_007146 [Naganishia adeliensis]